VDAVSSRYKLMKNLNFDYTASETHMYCTSCEALLKPDLKCTSCDFSFNKAQLIDNGSFFLTFKPKDLISRVLQLPKVSSNLRINLARRCGFDENIKNISDGKFYKMLNLGDNDITCMLNTDGVPVFKSSKFSLWPILFTINELDYDLGRKHVLPLGLWSGSKKPNFNTFLEPIVGLVQDLSVNKLTWFCESESINSCVYFPILAADSVARPIVQGLNQFNGAYGCTWCLCKGESLKNPENPNSHKWIYPPTRISNMEKRSKQQFIAQLKEYKSLLSTNPKLKSHYGIRSASKLLLFPKFDIVHGFVFDYMHTALLGISRTFTKSWLDSKNHNAGFYIGRKLKDIDHKFLKTLVPFTVNRTVRSINERTFWKASEWRTWTYVSGIVLEGILPSNYLEHFLKFVKAIMILCSASISPANLTYAENLLFCFVEDVESLYGSSYCTYNVHLLLHAAECVRNWGPLSKLSAFTFEHYNGILLGYFQGTVKVPIQISSRILEVIQMPLRNKFISNSSAFDYFESMLEHKRTGISRIVNSHALIGGSQTYYFSDKEKSDLLKIGAKCTEQSESYKSIVLFSKVFNIYTKSTTRRCNSIVRLDSGSYYVIHNIIVVGGQDVCVIVSKLVSDCILEDCNTFTVKKIRKQRKLISVDRIDPVKVLVISANESGISHIVQLPNMFEME